MFCTSQYFDAPRFNLLASCARAMAYKATLVGAGSNAPTLSKEQIQELVDARSEAKAARDFGKADKLRLQLARSCVQIDDASSAWSCQVSK